MYRHMEEKRSGINSLITLKKKRNHKGSANFIIGLETMLLFKRGIKKDDVTTRERT